jgi:hypothetical protein
LKIVTIAILLVLAACKGSEEPAKLKGGAALQLADGSPISQASTDESNPYLVKMSDGYLVLVFSSDRTCAGCTAGMHNIFLSRSVTTYNDDARLPAFNQPAVFSVAATPLNQQTPISLGAAAIGSNVRIFFTNSIGKIQWRDVPAAGANFDVAYLQIIDNWLWQAHEVIGISADGSKLFGRGKDGVVTFDPFGADAVLAPIVDTASAASVVQVPGSVSGISESYLVLTSGRVRAMSHTTAGEYVRQINTPAADAGISVKSVSALSAGQRTADIVVLSGTAKGNAKNDLYVLDGSNATPEKIWQALVEKPTAAGIPVPAERHPAQNVPSRVYGQTDFVSNTQGVSATQFARPHDVFADPKGGIFVADGHGIGGGTGRAVFFPGIATTAVNPPVYGKANLTDTTVGATASLTSVNTQGVFADANGVYLADTGNNRVLFFPGNSAIATRVYGQNGVLTANALNNGTLAGNGANCLNQPQGIATDSTGVYIADSGNSRVLFFPNISTTATRVYGQGAAGNVFTTATTGNSATALNSPSGVHVDRTGVYIGEVPNNRVVFFPGTSVTGTRFYGQFASTTCNVANNIGGCTGGAPNVNSLSGPRYVRSLGNHVYINDYANNRILYYIGTSTTATVVYGQTGSFATNGTGTTLTTFFQPLGIGIDGTGLFATDWNNSRVLFFPVS